jgi:hypothetical protein
MEIKSSPRTPRGATLYIPLTCSPVLNTKYHRSPIFLYSYLVPICVPSSIEQHHTFKIRSSPRRSFPTSNARQPQVKIGRNPCPPQTNPFVSSPFHSCHSLPIWLANLPQLQTSRPHSRVAQHRRYFLASHHSLKTLLLQIHSQLALLGILVYLSLAFHFSQRSNTQDSPSQFS